VCGIIRIDNSQRFAGFVRARAALSPLGGADEGKAKHAPDSKNRPIHSASVYRRLAGGFGVALTGSTPVRAGLLVGVASRTSSFLSLYSAGQSPHHLGGSTLFGARWSDSLGARATEFYSLVRDLSPGSKTDGNWTAWLMDQRPTTVAVPVGDSRFQKCVRNPTIPCYTLGRPCSASSAGLEISA